MNEKLRIIFSILLLTLGKSWAIKWLVFGTLREREREIRSLEVLRWKLEVYMIKPNHIWAWIEALIKVHKIFCSTKWRCCSHRSRASLESSLEPRHLDSMQVQFKRTNVDTLMALESFKVFKNHMESLSETNCLFSSGPEHSYSQIKACGMVGSPHLWK